MLAQTVAILVLALACGAAAVVAFALLRRRRRVAQTRIAVGSKAASLAA